VPAPRPRVLLTTAAALGHFHPLAAIASALRDRGAEVRFATSPGFCPQVAAAGFDAVPCGMDWRSRDLAETWPDFRLVPPSERNAWVNSVMWAKRLPEAIIPDLLRVVDDWRPSLVLSGRAELAGPMVAELTGVPYATTSAGRVIGLREFVVATQRGRAELRSGLGLDPDVAGDALYRHLYLNHIPASFLPDELPVPARRDFRPAVFTEPTSDPPRWLRDVEPRSAIYLTLGSILGEVWPDAFVRVLDAVEPLGRTVVVTVGDGGDAQALAARFPGVHVANYIPQRLILDRAALLVCHGGINTLLGALSQGVPVLVLPTEQSDQPWNARRCRELGVGLSSDIEQADVAAIRDSAAAVLSDGSYRRAVAAWRADMLRLPPVEDSIELLLRLANEGSDRPDVRR
jgi:UDP:flavonoid glycosyltransferase YjiC (YdhE family)